jgi:hypothetical protein
VVVDPDELDRLRKLVRLDQDQAPVSLRKPVKLTAAAILVLRGILVFYGGSRSLAAAIDRKRCPMTSLEMFCRQIRARSSEHREAIHLVHGRRLLSQVVAILRQELDSMVRVIYLLSIADKPFRQQLVEASVNGVKWTVKGKSACITDREMVELAQSLHGWTQSVYKFGCAFIHLSSFHDYENRDPLLALPRDEKAAILKHMRAYHGGPTSSEPTFEDLLPYFPQVFEKVAGNVECYVQKLEAGEAPAKSAI